MRKLIFALAIFLPSICFGQVFKAGITAGPTFSQIAGDRVAGFYKLGFQAGFVSDIYISKNFSWGIELLYSQRGSASAFDADRFIDDFKISVDYIEVPVILSYNDKNDMSFYIGGSFNRILGTKYFVQGVELPFEDLCSESTVVDNPTKKNDLQGILGLRYNVSQILVVGARWNRSFTFFKRNVASTFPKQGMYHNSVTLRVEFIFSALRE